MAGGCGGGADAITCSRFRAQIASPTQTSVRRRRRRRRQATARQPIHLPVWRRHLRRCGRGAKTKWSVAAAALANWGAEAAEAAAAGRDKAIVPAPTKRGAISSAALGLTERTFANDKPEKQLLAARRRPHAARLRGGPLSARARPLAGARRKSVGRADFRPLTSAARPSARRRGAPPTLPSPSRVRVASAAFFGLGARVALCPGKLSRALMLRLASRRLGLDLAARGCEPSADKSQRRAAPAARRLAPRARASPLSLPARRLRLRLCRRRPCARRPLRRSTGTRARARARDRR